MRHTILEEYVHNDVMVGDYFCRDYAPALSYRVVDTDAGREKVRCVELRLYEDLSEGDVKQKLQDIYVHVFRTYNYRLIRPQRTTKEQVEGALRKCSLT